MRRVATIVGFAWLAFPALLAAAEPFLDVETALMWQDVPENRGVLHTWKDAKEYCERLDWGGFDDWWLPSENELVSIVDMTRPQGRQIKKGILHYKGEAYWTSSTYAWNAPHAWVVSFRNGSTYTLEKERYAFARCVRCSDFKACILRFYNK